MLRTLGYTDSTARTLIIVYFRKSVFFDMNGIKGACTLAVAKSYTTPITFLCSVNRNLCGLAGFYAYIVALISANIVRALAG